MATPQLPSTTSLVDFLSSQKQNASFSARRKLYNDLGFSRRLGEYVGSPSQNINLLRELQKSNQQTTTPATAQQTRETLTPETPVRMSPSGMQSLSSAFQSLLPTTPPAVAQTPAPAPRTETPAPTRQRFSISDVLGARQPFSLAEAIGRPQQPAQITRPAITEAPVTPPAPLTEAMSRIGALPPTITQPRADVSSLGALREAGITPPVTPTPEVAPRVQELPPTEEETAVQTAQTTDAQTQTDTGLSASKLYPEIFGEGVAGASEADLVNQWLESNEGRIFMEREDLRQLSDEAKAEQAKAQLEAKYETERASLEQRLAANGLAFSGIRASRVKALADSLAASELNVDRQLASKLLDANLNLRENILKGVADLAKNAKDGRREAIQQLNAIGYAVVGDQLVPTLTSQREERAMRAEERAAAASRRAERSLELSERRLGLAEEAAVRRGKNAAQVYKNTITTVLESGLTPDDALDGVIQQAITTGVALNTEEQAAILAEAQRLQPTIKVQEKLPETAPETGFFNRLFRLF